MQGTKNAAWYIVLHTFHRLLNNLTKSMPSKCLVPIPISVSHEASSGMQLRQGDAWAELWKAKKGWEQGRLRMAVGTASTPRCLISVLLLILFSAWYSFSSNPDPLRSYPSANKAILLDFFHGCDPDLLPTHLADASLARVSLVYTAGIYTL